MSSREPGFGYDMVFEATRRRAARGDQGAARTHLVMLIHGLQEAHGMVLTPRMRARLAETLIAIYLGTDAREALFMKPRNTTSKKWGMLPRNAQIVRDMNWLITDGLKPWPAAGELAEAGTFCDEHGEPLTQKTINNLWLKCKDDPDYKLVIESPKLPD